MHKGGKAYLGVRETRGGNVWKTGKSEKRGNEEKKTEKLI